MDPRSHARELLALMDADVPHRIQDTFRAVLSLGSHGDTVERISSILLISRRSLHRNLVGHGLPDPATVRRWGRVLLAMEAYRESRTLSLDALAWLQAWSGASAISRSVVDTTGIRPGEWREKGGCMAQLHRGMVSTWARNQERAA